MANKKTPRSSGKDSPRNVSITSSQQSGGITAQTVTISTDIKKPWYKKTAVIIGGTLGALASIVTIVGYCENRAVSLSKQMNMENEVKKIVVSSTGQIDGITAAVVNQNAKQIINHGVGAEQLAKVADDLAEIKALLAGKERESGREFAAEFPFGYTLFALTETDGVIPFISPGGSRLDVDWAGSYYTATRETVDLHLSAVKMGSVLFHANEFSLRRTVGSSITLHLATKPEAPYPGAVPFQGMWLGNKFVGSNESMEFRQAENPDVSMVVKLVKTAKAGTVVLLGIKPFQEAREKINAAIAARIFTTRKLAEITKALARFKDNHDLTIFCADPDPESLRYAEQLDGAIKSAGVTPLFTKGRWRDAYGTGTPRGFILIEIQDSQNVPPIAEALKDQLGGPYLFAKENSEWPKSDVNRVLLTIFPSVSLGP